MTKIMKSTTISAGFETEDGQHVADFYASVSEAGTTINMNIVDQTLYEANKKQVRADKRKFDEYVYEVEDKAGESV